MAQKSKQPRFSSPKEQAANIFTSIFRWGENFEQDEPIYSVDSRRRDTWLSAVWQLEPHIAGVIKSVVDIDKNRGWTMIGGRNQVKRYTDILHNFMVAPTLRGWRLGISTIATSYYISDLGGIVEVGRQGKGGPLRSLYTVDPTRCRLTGSIDKPLRYFPAKGKAQEWEDMDFFRITSIPSIREEYYGLGFCSLSRCIEFLKLLVAVWRHDSEMLGSRAPRGLMLLQGISEEQWNTALSARDVKLDSLGYQYFGSVMVLASSGLETLDAKLIALSQLPANFDIQVFVSMAIYGIALCFGYDPSEFYPVQFGALGRGTEMEVQAKKATGKGGMDFVLNFQEQLQRELPNTLQWEFDQRDDTGELQAIALKQAVATLVKTLHEAGETSGTGVISHEEARILLAGESIIPEEWTLSEEEIIGDDTGAPIRNSADINKLLESSLVYRLAELTPAEPIVRYHYPSDKVTLLFERADDVLRHRLWAGARRTRQRILPEVLYAGEDFIITEADVDTALAEAADRVGEPFAELLSATPVPEG